MKDAGCQNLRVNGSEVSVDCPPGRRLSDVLREDLDLTGELNGGLEYAVNLRRINLSNNPDLGEPIAPATPIQPEPPVEIGTTADMVEPASQTLLQIVAELTG